MEADRFSQSSREGDVDSIRWHGCSQDSPATAVHAQGASPCSLDLIRPALSRFEELVAGCRDYHQHRVKKEMVAHHLAVAWALAAAFRPCADRVAGLESAATCPASSHSAQARRSSWHSWRARQCAGAWRFASEPPTKLPSLWYAGLASSSCTSECSQSSPLL